MHKEIKDMSTMTPASNIALLVVIILSLILIAFIADFMGDPSTSLTFQFLAWLMDALSRSPQEDKEEEKNECDSSRREET